MQHNRVYDKWRVGNRTVQVSGPLVSDDADVIRRLALQGEGIVYKSWLDVSANIAAGEQSWGPAAELARLLPGTGSGTYREADTTTPGGMSHLVENVVKAAGDRPLVVVVRDVHRHRWMAGALHALLDSRPDAVVVETGVPQAPPCGALHIATHGAARVCAQAAAEVIAGR